ncbi:VOC family protein [Methylobacterium planeticum]|uniref:VOC family protein n=1 Tax=Methylobacterium planeticum TaxID=2615211 RepID=A0A6N6MPQ2_9HYPH|nr:VOC family protein [Methylobacterium planeticum]KAB1073492.1 VOC family protein [Methylobacterium planeticum]
MPHDGLDAAASTPDAGRSRKAPPHAPASLLDAAPYRIGRVTLVARDLDGLARFYQDAVGLAVLSRETRTVRLGAAGRVLLELRHDPAARPWSPREAGLFHTAFLLPTRGDLGAWLAHAAERGIALSGASDHLVSEAVYLTDPEGNGIEIYADRAEARWPRADGGTLVMRNDPIDRAGLLRAAPGPWAGMPPGGRVGHVHLQVGELEAAERFYAGLLGFDLTCRYPGALFLGAGGYHHQLAANVWNSRGAPPRPAGTTGLAEIELLTHPTTSAQVRDRCREAGLPVEVTGAALVLHDPWGMRLRLLAAEPGR